ncbi:MAG: hypothetical protein QGH45_25385 [Myxococcota bacterium]|jgi:hypothetical protein|nr:hypothetical protein [Myxococcota bacterium]
MFSCRRVAALVVALLILGLAPPATAGDDEPGAGDLKRELQDRLDAWFEGACSGSSGPRC